MRNIKKTAQMIAAHSNDIGEIVRQKRKVFSNKFSESQWGVQRVLMHGCSGQRSNSGLNVVIGNIVNNKEGSCLQTLRGLQFMM